MNQELIHDLFLTSRTLDDLESKDPESLTIEEFNALMIASDSFEELMEKVILSYGYEEMIRQMENLYANLNRA